MAGSNRTIKEMMLDLKEHSNGILSLVSQLKALDRHRLDQHKIRRTFPEIGIDLTAILVELDDAKDSVDTQQAAYSIDGAEYADEVFIQPGLDTAETTAFHHFEIDVDAGATKGIIYARDKEGNAATLGTPFSVFSDATTKDYVQVKGSGTPDNDGIYHIDVANDYDILFDAVIGDGLTGSDTDTVAWSDDRIVLTGRGL